MAKPKKTPSGKWRIQPCKNGRRASFIADSKSEALLLASRWLTERHDEAAKNIMLAHAIESYIDSCEPVLSPATVRGYDIALRRILKLEISKLKIDKISTADLQEFVSALSRAYAPKTVKNTYALVGAAFRYYGISLPGAVNLPQTRVAIYDVPSAADLSRILDLCSGTDIEVAIMLAAFGGLRRSEIVALTSDDIREDCIVVRAAVVKGRDRILHKKTTKTEGSTRLVSLPDFVMDRIRNIDGRICPLSPAAITRRFERLRDQVGIATRFHDLRHYSASLMHALGVPDQYVIARHGWRTDYALKRIYRNELPDFAAAMDQKLNDYTSAHFAQKNAPNAS